jgi:phage putative head morphogenesis protein, SPP1 gp7 family
MTSQEYWSKRETEQLKRNIRDETLYTQEINKIYDNMMDNIQREINGFYAKYATSEGITLADAKKRVSQLDIDTYNRKAERYVKNRTFGKVANEEMRLYNATMKINRLEMLKSNIGLELVRGFDELQKYYDTILTDRTLTEFERQAGILGKSIQNNQKLAHSIVNASFHNARFSDRVWMHQDMLKNELAGLLKTGLIQGRNPRVLATHLRKLFGVSKANSERLMRTELARVQTETQKRSYIENGYDKYEWISTEDSKVCDACARIDGQIFDVKDMQVGVNAPPIHPQDRCSTAAYMDREEFEKWLSEQNGVAKSSKGDILKKKNIGDYVGTKITKHDNKSIREWYYANVGDIFNQIDTTKTLEEQARQAFKFRNQYKREARLAMSDKETVERLEKKRPMKTFEELIKDKMNRKELSREDAVRDILETATKTNEDVNKEFGL